MSDDQTSSNGKVYLMVGVGCLGLLGLAGATLLCLPIVGLTVVGNQLDATFEAVSQKVDEAP